ncbi:hypothetical protein [Cloacibacillus sp. An23]|uniref:hypothetical protein n=1 Tax=Cloacibacillus sp. An23 TaxID=1965591 RepID=UPI000B388D31|nr:hypothetical protein [Cloacibacillus sp. An23]OUO89991.1 hypothetical protein B5F39_13890 [Cloacibacillus sp. An23]
MSDVMTFSKRTASGLEEALRTVLLDADNKVPAEALRIVGAIADGAVIESGSNTNGYWVKLADGTAIAHNAITQLTNTDASAPISGIYRYTVSVTFPMLFISPPDVVGSIGANSNTHGWGTAINRTVSGATFHHYTTVASLSTTALGGWYIAIGKWK